MPDKESGYLRKIYPDWLKVIIFAVVGFLLLLANYSAGIYVAFSPVLDGVSHSSVSFILTMIGYVGFPLAFLIMPFISLWYCKSFSFAIKVLILEVVSVFILMQID